MLRVPARRQPDSVSCLPTCVEVVLDFLGYHTEASENRRWCYTTRVGSDVDLAIQGLDDAGVDAELLQCDSLERLRDLIAEGRPPIVLFPEGGSWSHSVVVCSVDDAQVTIMDPRAGDYVALSVSDFSASWLPHSGETLLVGGSPIAARSSARRPSQG